MKTFFFGACYLFLGILQAITLFIALFGFYLIYMGKPTSVVILAFIPLVICTAIAWQLLYRQKEVE